MPADGELRSVNPATGAEIATYPMHDAAEVEARLRRAHDVFQEWSGMPVADRAARLQALADLLSRRADRYGRLISEEMGKPIREARGEVEKCAWACRHFAEQAVAMLAPDEVATDARRSYVAYDPLGPVLAIMPWNFPFWQVLRFGAPALAAGNVILLKHAPNVPGCALAVEEACREAGFPEGALQALLIDVDPVEGIIADPRVRAVTLTGSTRAGRAVAAAAGRHLKKTVLELGGSDPFIVLDDADVAEAARVGAAARCQNSGQSCIAAKRFIVADACFDAFVDAFVNEMASLVVGDPLDEATRVGPLARADLRETLDRQVRESVRQGARLLLGGEVPDGAGYFYPPTVLADVRPGMPAYAEELFGPVAVLFRASGEEEAVRLANDTSYGLGASVWTADPERGERLARRIEAGAVFVNGMVRSDPRLPFGGVKDSGYGRELSVHGLREFVNTRTVWVG